MKTLKNPNSGPEVRDDCHIELTRILPALKRFGGVEIDEARVLAASSTPPPPECRLENSLDR